MLFRLGRFLIAAYYMVFGGIGWTPERDPYILAHWAVLPAKVKRQHRVGGWFHMTDEEFVAEGAEFVRRCQEGILWTSGTRV